MPNKARDWFQGVASVSGVLGYNPVGLLAAPFGVDIPTGRTAVGPGVLSPQSQPTQGVIYYIVGSPLVLSASAASGDALLITVYAPQADSAGANFVPVAFASVMMLVRLPLGYAVEFSGFIRPLLINCTCE